MTTVALINRSTIADMDAQLARMAPALTAYLLDVAGFWGADCLADVVAVAKGGTVPAGARQIVIADHCDDPGALGYHVDDTGIPRAIVGALDDLADGCLLSVTISHELAEMQVDPLCTRMATIGGVEFIVEVADAVEADGDSYERPDDHPGIRLSNFVTPAYFGMPNPPGAAADRYDMRGLLKAPCPAMRPGGYLAELRGGQWVDITARTADRRRSSRAERSGRTAYRMRAHAQA